MKVDSFFLTFLLIHNIVSSEIINTLITSGHNCINYFTFERIILWLIVYNKIIFEQEFRNVLTTKPELKIRLEDAIRSQQESLQQKGKSAAEGTAVNSAPHKPTIKLKTDFSNFV